MIPGFVGLSNIIRYLLRTKCLFSVVPTPRGPVPLCCLPATQGPHHGTQEPPTSPSRGSTSNSKYVFQNQAQPPPAASPPPLWCPSTEALQLLPYSLSLAVTFSHQSPVSALQMSFFFFQIWNIWTILFLWYITVKYLSKSIPSPDPGTTTINSLL